MLNNLNEKAKFHKLQTQLASYKFKIIHKPGNKHTNADALSRLQYRNNKNKTSQ